MHLVYIDDSGDEKWVCKVFGMCLNQDFQINGMNALWHSPGFTDFQDLPHQGFLINIYVNFLMGS